MRLTTEAGTQRNTEENKSGTIRQQDLNQTWKHRRQKITKVQQEITKHGITNRRKLDKAWGHTMETR